MRKMLICLAPFAAALAFAAVDAGAGDTVGLEGKSTFSARVVDGSATTIRTADAGSGTLTHLGRFTMVASEVVHFDTGAVTDGWFTFTAANGDTVSGTYTGTADPGLTGYLASGPITGGTGRFAGATGEIVFHGTLDPASFGTDVITGSDVITGTISTVGSRSS